MSGLRTFVHPPLASAEREALERRVRTLALEEVDGLSLLVLPEVFNGIVFRTGLLLARAAAARSVLPGARALDMGTGTGLGALFLARAGWRVAAVDTNPEAVRCARINALVNRLEGRIDVHEGDLFSPLADGRFDLVLFNPPFFEGAPRDLHDLAWRGTDVLPRFLDALPSRLAPGGEALLVLSSHAPQQERTLLAAPRLAARREEAHEFGDETISIFSARIS